MARTSIVTDSSSGLSPEEAEPLGIAIAPMHIQIDGHAYREGVDLSLFEYHQLVAGDSVRPTTSPPTVREFHELFRKLSRGADEVIAVGMVRRLVIFQIAIHVKGEQYPLVGINGYG